MANPGSEASPPANAAKSATAPKAAKKDAKPAAAKPVTAKATAAKPSTVKVSPAPSGAKVTDATTSPASTAAPTSTIAAATKPKTAKSSQNSVTPASPPSITVTLPVEQVVTATVAVAKVPVALVRRVIPARNGLPLYVGVGALAVVGAVEWPVAAAAGAGLAVLRRWGPLRAASNGSATTEKAVVSETK